MFGFRLPKAGSNLAGPPAYLSVPNYKTCMKEKDMGSFKVWCLPCGQPEGCEDASWEKLSGMDDLIACAEEEEE
jgi:hypothetical protein